MYQNIAGSDDRDTLRTCPISQQHGYEILTAVTVMSGCVVCYIISGRFGGAYSPHLQGHSLNQESKRVRRSQKSVCISTLKMEAVNSSEVSVKYRIIWSHLKSIFFVRKVLRPI
jgi:hypothetical protein